MELKANQKKALSDVLFILWAGGAALLSYSLVYALRKPFTAATFDGLDFFGMDYKTATRLFPLQTHRYQGDFGDEKREPAEVHYRLCGCGRIVFGVVRSVAPSL